MGYNTIWPEDIQETQNQWNITWFYSVLKNTERHLVKLLLKESEKVVLLLNNEFETLLLSSFPKDFKAERDRIAKRGKKNCQESSR